MLGVGQIGRMAGLDVCDYGRRDSSGVLVASGTGLMMGLMDAAPCLRWCLDLDTSKDDRAKEFFLRLIQTEAAPIVIAGWWMISDPTPVRNALRAYQRVDHVLVHANVELSERVPSLDIDDLVSRLASWQSVAPREPTIRVPVRQSLHG